MIIMIFLIITLTTTLTYSAVTFNGVTSATNTTSANWHQLNEHQFVERHFTPAPAGPRWILPDSVRGQSAGILLPHRSRTTFL